jgi:DNA-binding NarL/FixJ family response regulator
VSIRVLVADDHAQFRSMIITLLRDAGFDVVGEASNSDRAVDLAMAHAPDVALLDIRMPGDGITAARRIASALPGTGVLMLTVSAASDDVLDALQAGAQGYILKGATPDEIVDAVRAVSDGHAVVAPAIAPVVVHEIRRSRSRFVRTGSGASVRLTEREWNILELLDQGRSTVEIAEMMYVAPVTIRTHIAALTRKLNVRERADAVALLRSQR